MPSQGTSAFDLFALRFHCSAAKPVHFPPGETANLFRGQLGKILYRRDRAMYKRFFAPARNTGSSGLHDPPRPFVLRVRHLDGATLLRFHIGLNVFETNQPDLVAIYDAIRELAWKSLRAEVVSREGDQMLRFPLADVAHASRRAASTLVSTFGARVTFLSPTELKNQERPDFGPLFSRIRDRISTLRALYGSGPLEIDFKSMGARAAEIRTTRCDIQHVEAERVSHGTGRRHPLNGFIGIAEYEGDLTEFIPYLEIAAYTGVGRQTVWGKGEISVEAQ